MESQVSRKGEAEGDSRTEEGGIEMAEAEIGVQGEPGDAGAALPGPGEGKRQALRELLEGESPADTLISPVSRVSDICVCGSLWRR